MNSIYSTTPVSISNLYGKHVNEMAAPGTAADVFSMIPHFFYEFNDDPHVLVIYAGPVANPPRSTFVYSDIAPLRDFLIKNVKSDTKVCFDNLYEGSVQLELNTIYRSIENTGIKTQQIFYFSCALDANEILEEYLRTRPHLGKINIFICNSWEYILFKNSKHFVNAYNIKVKQKKFLCFNRVLREHRLALFGLIAHRNLLDHCFYSFFTDIFYGDNADDMLNRISSGLTDKTSEEMRHGYTMNKHKIPFKLNIESSENQNTIKEDDMMLFDESYLSLVTETFFFPRKHKDIYDFDSIFFSEKIYKPILMKHPFILVARPNSLKYLRKMGYKTFAPFIDETYDTIPDDEARLLAIVAELERLNRFTDDQWIEWQTNVAAIVEHNYLIMANRKKHEYAFKRPNYETKY